MDELNQNNDSSDPWSQADKELGYKPGLLESKKFWWLIGLLVFIALLGGGAYYYFNQPSLSPQAEINFSKPDQLSVGQPFDLSVTVSNNSATELQGGNLALTLPTGLVFLNIPQSEKFSEIDIGTLSPNTIHSETFRLLPTGDADNNIRHISATYQYRGTSNNKVQFEKKADLDLTVGPGIASLSIEAPQKILSGEAFSLRFLCRNNTKQTLNGLSLKAVYPSAFTFSTSTLPASNKDNNQWIIPSLLAGATQEIVVQGNVTGPGDSFYGFTGELSQNLGGQTHLLQKLSTNSTVQSTPLTLTVVANNSSDYIAHPGDLIRYVLTYHNNSDVTLSDVVLTATLTGDFYEFSKADANKATFDSVQNVFTWNPQNTLSLAHVAPGAEGQINLSLPLLANYPAPKPQSSGNSVKITARIESPTVPPNTAISKTVTVTSLETKIKGTLTIKTQGFWRDASSKILNLGPYPIKVNTPTQFTIHWVIQAAGSDFEKLQISAPLSPGTQWTNSVKSNVSSLPAFNSAASKITWQIDKLMAGSKAEGIFQVVVTPAANQISQFIPLIGESKITATDTSVTQDSSGTNPGVSSNVPDDVTISGVRWVVP